MKIVKSLRVVLAALLLWPALSIAQSFQPLNNATTANLGSPYLLTDGTVLIQNNFTTGWVKLTPDQFGSYINGTWSTVASLPAGYSPFYYAAGVLADGRLVIIGGEDNYAGSVTYSDTNLGAVYDPKSNTWTPIAPPTGFANIGDAPSVVLPNGQFLLGDAFSTQIALLDPATLTWTFPPATGKATSNNEEGFTLLPDGSVLDVNVSGTGIAQRYLPSTSQWISAGSTPQPLQSAGEMGPAVLRPNGTVFAMGASGANAVYTPPSTLTGTGTWTAAPNLAIGDAPACLLPDGNVLVEASGGFYEFDGTNLNQVVVDSEAAYAGRLLALPNGQVLFTAGGAQIYTSSGTPNAAWAPTVTSFPATIGPGATYSIYGTQFNGMSQAVAYGDDYQAATNYPLVRITNQVTGHVFYARTHDHSTMGVATGSTIVSTNFDVPANIELGTSSLVVVANGIPSTSVSITVGTLKSTGVALVSSLNPSNGGKAVTFTATVTGPGGTPTGTVTFLDGVTRIGTGILNGSGVATFSTSSLIVGSHSITATYGGDTNFTSSTSTAVAQLVTGTAATAVLTSTLNPSAYNVAITLAVTVTGIGGTPTGTVAFFDAASWLESSNLNSGTASFTSAALPIGSHPITVQYSGDTSFASATSNTLTQVINAVASTTTLISTPNPAAAGQSVTLTATVTSNLAVTGTATFYDGSISLGTSTLNGNGIATFMTSGLTSGSHSITAIYNGDSDHIASTSNVITQVILGSKPSTTTMTSSLNPAGVEQSVTFTAMVSGASGTPTGKVTFADGAIMLGTSTLNGSGVATFTTSTLAIASHTITAQYSGDGNYAPGTSTQLMQVVNLNPSATALTASITSSISGQAVTFSATVTNTGGPIPTSSVTFKDGSSTLFTGTLNGSGIATYTTTSLAVGSHSISAIYSGDASNTASTSPAVVVTVEDFSLPSTAPTISVTAPGQTGMAAIAVTPLSGFTGTVSFSCSTPANMSESSCSAPSAQISGATAATSTLTVTTTASQQLASISDQTPRLAPTIAGAVLSGCLWFGIPAFRRRRFASSIFLALLVGVMGAVGCSGGSSGGGGQADPGTPAGSYTLVLTGTSGTSSHSVNVSVTVQ
jgi:hypothetical protein